MFYCHDPVDRHAMLTYSCVRVNVLCVCVCVCICGGQLELNDAFMRDCGFCSYVCAYVHLWGCSFHCPSISRNQNFVYIKLLMPSKITNCTTIDYFAKSKANKLIEFCIFDHNYTKWKSIYISWANARYKPTIYLIMCIFFLSAHWLF